METRMPTKIQQIGPAKWERPISLSTIQVRQAAREMLNKAILTLSADAKPGTGPGLAHANQSLVCLFAVSHPWLMVNTGGLMNFGNESVTDRQRR
jgi:hypothetical protein